MSDFWSALMAVLVIVAPLWLAWMLLGPSGRREEPGPMSKGPGKH